MKDESFVVCPEKLCRQEFWGQGKVKRLIGTGAGLIFKGSGFYTTDYRSANYQESAKKESGPTTKSDDAKSAAEKPKETGSSKGEGAKSGSGSDKVAGSSGTSGSTPSTSS